MNKIQKKFGAIMQKAVDSAMGNGLMQEETTASGRHFVFPEMPGLIRQAAAESCVLLKNDGVLPLPSDSSAAVFGRCQLDWFYVGYGSGGDVHAPYYVNLMDALENRGACYDRSLAETYRQWTEKEENKAYHGWWGHWPYSHPEMPLSPETVQKAAAASQTAIVIIGRAAGEDRENVLEPGSYYLTDAEISMLDAVTSAFTHTVVLLNIGNIIDMSWTERYGDKLSALMIVWLGGMESGNAVCDVLYGNVCPCGRLPDSIARHYEDYPSAANFGGASFNDYDEGIFMGWRYFDRNPEKVLWPFGFGLSYTSFSLEPELTDPRTVRVRVVNTGHTAGKETVLLYCSAPEGTLEKPVRVLAAFGKTKSLKPGESETLTLSFDDKTLASYDEASHCFILEPGVYHFTANGIPAGQWTLPERTVVEQCSPICLPSPALRRRILDNLPEEIVPAGQKEVTLTDVARGTASLDAFIARLSDRELADLTRGHGMMNSDLGVPGNAGVFGGILPELRKKEIEPVSCCDGPAGLRIKRYSSLLPCGTALAATWNCELTEKLHVLLGREMVHYGVDVHLAPGMNLHRNPLCGRNFEYFSEDPLLSGKMAAAAVRGVQSSGRASCPKHFACNNQETKRNVNDSRVSERALLELYLRNFEICVKEARPAAIMTSYNKINGVWAHYHYDLVTTVLRDEWGFDGCVMTDWWMQRSQSPEFPAMRDNAYRVRAQVDLLMPGNMSRIAKKYQADPSLLETLGRRDGITRGELQRSARNILKLILKLKF